MIELLPWAPAAPAAAPVLLVPLAPLVLHRLQEELDVLVGHAFWRQLYKHRSSRKIRFSETIFKRIGLPKDLFSD